MYFYGVFEKENKHLKKIPEIVEGMFDSKELFVLEYNKEINNFEPNTKPIVCEWVPVSTPGVNWFKFYAITKFAGKPVKNAYVVFGNELVPHGERDYTSRDVYFHCTGNDTPTITDAWFYWSHVREFDDVSDGTITQIERSKFEWNSNRKFVPSEAWELSMELCRSYLRRATR